MARLDMALMLDSTLWVDFTRRKTPPALRKMILRWILDPRAAIAIHHNAELVTFDADYTSIAKAAPLRVILLDPGL